MKDNQIASIRATITIIICDEGCECSSSDNYCVNCLSSYSKLFITHSMFKCVEECKDDYSYYVINDANQKECYYSCYDNQYGKKKILNNQCLIQCPSDTNDVNDLCIEKSLFENELIVHSSLSKFQFVDTLNRILTKIDKNKVWVNPDCGLKTRGIEETVKSLKNLVAAAKIVRGNLI